MEERKSPAPSRREVELSKVIQEALEPVLFLEQFPRTVIDLFIEVLQADGGTRCAGVTVSTLALADASIPMKDLVVACAAGKAGGHIVLDLNDVEDKEGEADVPVAYLTNSDSVSLIQMDGVLTAEELEQSLTMSIEGCKQIYNLQKEALKEKYLSIKGEVEEECPQ